jgi:hypothetical protein
MCARSKVIYHYGIYRSVKGHLINLPKKRCNKNLFLFVNRFPPLRLQSVLSRQLYRQGGDVNGAAKNHPASTPFRQEQGRNLHSGSIYVLTN